MEYSNSGKIFVVGRMAANDRYYHEDEFACNAPASFLQLRTLIILSIE